MASTIEHQQHQTPEGARVEPVGDGMSTAALITAWVGATVPLLPAVALLVALAGRKRSLTRWLNTVALVVSAVFLAAQLIVAAVFGATIVKVVNDALNRDSTASATAFDDSELGMLGDDSAPVDPAPEAPAPTDTAAGGAGGDTAGDTDASEVQTTMPGMNADLDTAYLDTMGSTLEGSGFELAEFDQDFLYRIAGETCTAMDGGGTLDQASQAINDQDIPRAVSGSIATVAIVTYCPQHYDAL